LLELVIIACFNSEPVDVSGFDIVEIIAVVQEDIYILMNYIDFVYNINQLLAFRLTKLGAVTLKQLFCMIAYVVIDAAQICSLLKVATKVEDKLLDGKNALHEINEHIELLDQRRKIGGLLDLSLTLRITVLMHAYFLQKAIVLLCGLANPCSS
jgi:hypothetical protein